MADNTLQFEWIVLLKLGLDACFAEREDVFVAGNLLWYPLEGHNALRQAPDVMVAIGRPRGYRGSYLQWAEGGIAPQVVFEILSPGNRAAKMQEKFAFYQHFGVQEYYLYDPHKNKLKAYLREGSMLGEIPSEKLRDWASPLLGIRLRWADDALHLYEPNGKPFRPYLDLAASEAAAIAELRQSRKLLQQTLEQLRAAERRAESAEQRAERLAERLRHLGIDPDTI
jgi:Uma2 family endonuclease